MEKKHLSNKEIEAGLSHVLASPKDQGELKAIVVRPEVNQRERLAAARLSPEGGVEGDRWATSTTLRRADGSPDPRTQVSLMNARILQLIANADDRMALAGDNLIVDLDLSEGNLSVGQKLAIGEVTLQITDVPHTGCDKFADRFGTDAVRYVNAPATKPLHLRGLYAQVLTAGTLRVGQVVRKVE
jgi:MOSC domain-containing protein YiiM